MVSSSMRISQCMIVKNEEKNLEKALSWGKGVVYEQIVVDTGSTDRTVEMAALMGAKVYHFEWIDDFAAAKNYAISKAEGDWIAFLDADEFMPSEWAEKLPSKLGQVDKAGYYAFRSPWICIDETGAITTAARHCRLFKRIPGLGYLGAIHEVLGYQGKLLPQRYVADSEGDFPVYHTGYQPKEMKEKKKNQRNIRILEKELAKRPDDYNVMGYLGDSYRGEADKTEAVNWYRKAIAAMPRCIDVMDERSAATFVYLMELLLEENRDAEFLEIYETAKARVPWMYDSDYLAGGFYLGKKDYGKTVFHLEQALRTAEKYGTDAYAIYMSGNILGVWEQLAWCYYELGSLAESIRCCVTLLKADRRRMTALTVLLKALKQEPPSDVVLFLGNLYNVRQPSDRIFLLKGAIAAKADGVLLALRKECTAEELAVLDQMK